MKFIDGPKTDKSFEFNINEKEKEAYIEEYNWRCTYANAFEYMSNKPDNTFYYLFTTKSSLSSKMIPEVLSYVFIININGKSYFSFCPQSM